MVISGYKWNYMEEQPQLSSNIAKGLGLSLWQWAFPKSPPCLKTPEGTSWVNFPVTDSTIKPYAFSKIDF